MRIPLTHGRNAAFAVVLGATGAAAMTLPQSANAATCGGSYTVQSGDTLAAIAQRCDTSVNALMEANPQIDNPRVIRVGWELDMPGARSGGETQARAGAGSPDRARAPQQQQQPGPGAAIARSIVGTLAGAIGSEDGKDISELQPEDFLDVGDADRRVSVQPKAGAAGAPVTIRGSGFEPGEDVTIGAGPPEAEWKGLVTARADAEGDVVANVKVPDWAENADEVVFVIDTQAGRTFTTDRFDVVDASDPDAPRGGIVALEGRVTQGTECKMLETPDGDRYALVSDDVGITMGEYVEIEGRRADASFCMAGEDTIDVGLIREVTPPDERDEPRAALPAGFVTAAWAARGGNCARPEFDVTANSAGGQVVETSLDGSPRTGYVRVGEDPAFIFDQPRRELALEQRSRSTMTVMPPESGPVDLGGVTVESGGTVFYRCG